MREFEALCPASRFVTVDKDKARKPPLAILPNVGKHNFLRILDMKLQNSIYLVFLILLINENILNASEKESGVLFSKKYQAIENQNPPDSSKKKPKLYTNVSTGLILNNTFGNHPIFNLTFGLRHKKNQYNLAYEYRFGNSENYYQILDNETHRETNAYKANYIGFEYERVFINNPKHKFYSNAGIGVDWILIKKNETISENKIISGTALNIGLGYTYLIKKKHGPNIVLLYHFADLKNKKGTEINKNSFLIRVTYFLGKDND